MKKYSDPEALIKGEPRVSSLFDQIPPRARDQLMDRGLFVGTVNEWEAYIRNIIRGNG